MTHRMRRPHLAAASAFAATLLLAGQAPAAPGTALEMAAEAGAEESSWTVIKETLFGDREIAEGTDVIAMEAPARAAEPALVPITLRLDPDKDIRTVTLVVDENPAPVAATFEIAPGAGLRELSTRVRVNAYSDVHAVAEAADGTLYMTKAFVKASGGCAAPAAKDPETAANQMGEMRLRRFGAMEGAPELNEAQLMIRHPNNSGLQKDQVTLLYIPAHFVNRIEVARAGETLFTMTGGISISEDPNFRFSYAGGTDAPFEVKATDTEGNAWAESFPAAGQS